MKFVKVGTALALVFFALFACTKSANNDASTYTNAATCTTAPSYSAQAKAVIDTKCATSGCHSAASRNYFQLPNGKNGVWSKCDALDFNTVGYRS